MRRWNGWGDDRVVEQLPGEALRFLEGVVGSSAPPQDALLADVVKRVPASRLPPHALVSTDPADRLRHARGQSLPDWIALRSGIAGPFPDGVAYPMINEDLRSLLQYAGGCGARVIPYGGGTSVVGHINPLSGEAPVLTVDMTRMNRLLNFDEESLLATFEAGVRGPDLEAQLRARGCTLGHFPQSFEYSTLGGWVATRSSGQQSLHYGRIEKLFAGGVLETPAGTLRLPDFPASAAGPDLRELVLGSEGRLGILAEVTVRTSTLPEREEFLAVFFPDFNRGCSAVRQILQAGLPLEMLRLSTAVETATTLALAGHENLVGLLDKLLALRGIGAGKCMLILGLSGKAGIIRAARGESLAIVGKWDGVNVGRTFGEQWHKHRFRTPYLRNSLWEVGYAIDTLETATGWANVPAMVEAVETAVREALADAGEGVHVFTHLSHVYPFGSSVYTTCLFRLGIDPEETLSRWRALKAAASRAIIAQGGTISHQHGVGVDHIPYLSAEKTSLGLDVIRDVCRRFDPQGLMNPGKLVLNK